MQKNTYKKAGRTLPLLERDKDGYFSRRIGKSNRKGELFFLFTFVTVEQQVKYMYSSNYVRAFM
ncbi:hypothetical protein J5TS2_04430 [Brevibacillus halotolerans]|nr:hypothetical protein J5TS2_04430 [Brevibacillus halotolerans]